MFQLCRRLADTRAVGDTISPSALSDFCGCIKCGFRSGLYPAIWLVAAGAARAAVLTQATAAFLSLAYLFFSYRGFPFSPSDFKITGVQVKNSAPPASISILKNALRGMEDPIAPVGSSMIGLAETIISAFPADFFKYRGIIAAEPVVWALTVILLIVKTRTLLR